MNRRLHIFKHSAYQFCARRVYSAAECLNIVKNDLNHTDIIPQAYSLGAKVTVESANSSLKFMLDNGNVGDVCQFLSKLQKSDVEPNVITCQLLSKIYARQANPLAILNLLSLMRDAGLNPTRQIIQNLAYAEAFVIDKKWNVLADEAETNQLVGIHRVANIYFKILKNSQFYSLFSIVHIYLNAALAFAHANNLNAVMAVLKHLCDNTYRGQPQLLAHDLYNYINELYFIFLNNNIDCDEVFSKLKPYLNLIPAQNGKDMLVSFSVEKLLPFVNSLIEKNNRKALSQINVLLRKKIKLIRQRTINSPVGMVDTCLQFLVDNRIDDFRVFLKKCQIVSDKNGEFFWFLLLKYFGTEGKLCERLEKALIIYFKISRFDDIVENINAKSVNNKRKLHRVTLLKFLWHAKVIDEKAEARSEKSDMLETILKTVENFESIKTRKYYEAILNNSIQIQ